MRKISLLLTMLLLLFSLTSCEFLSSLNPFEKEMTFEEYLEEEKLTVEKVNKSIKIDTNVVDVTKIDIPNTKVDILSNGENMTAYLWKTDQNLYFSMQDEAYYVNLHYIQGYISDNMQVSEDAEASDIIDSYLGLLFVQSSPEDKITLDKILSSLPMEYSDFEETDEPGKYRYKNDAIYRFISNLTNGRVSYSEIKEELEGLIENYGIYVYYDNNHINGYELNAWDDETRLDVSINLEFNRKDEIDKFMLNVDFLYSEEGGEGSSFYKNEQSFIGSLILSDGSISCDVQYFENKERQNYKETSNIFVSAMLNDEKISFSLNDRESDLKVELNAVLKDDFIETAEFMYFNLGENVKVNVTSKKVSIPENVKALESKAQNLINN